MQYQNYEDYMRSVLGYPVNNNNTYDNYNFQEHNYQPLYTKSNRTNEEMYPQIYKLINPMVCDVCNNYIGDINTQDLERMVDEVYKQVETNNEIIVKINIDNRSPNTINQSKNTISQRNNTEVENRQRRPDNPLLRDLIRILILNQIFGGHIRPPFRPPFPPPRPPRPPHHREIMPIKNTEYNNYFEQ